MIAFNKSIPEHLVPLIDDCWLHFITEDPDYSTRTVTPERLREDCSVFNCAFVGGYAACLNELPKSRLSLPKKCVEAALNALRSYQHGNTAAGLAREVADVLEAAAKEQTDDSVKMTDDRFNELLNGPLAHPMFMFRLTRLQMALREVVDSCGAAGIEALERHCRQREESDQRKAAQ